jgi:DNA-binding CsgD family transcriptional regulator
LLTEREREVLEQVVAGKLNKQIAAALDVSERTIKTLRAQGMDKLGVASPAELGVLIRAASPRAGSLIGLAVAAGLMQGIACPLGKSGLPLFPAQARGVLPSVNYSDCEGLSVGPDSFAGSGRRRRTRR